MIHSLSFSVDISCLANIDLHVRLQTLQLYFPTKLFHNSSHNQELIGNFSSVHKLIFANLNQNDSKVPWYTFTCKIAGVDLLFLAHYSLFPSPSCPLIIELFDGISCLHFTCFTYLLEMQISLLHLCVYLLVLIVLQSIFSSVKVFQYILLCDVCRSRPEIFPLTKPSQNDLSKAVRQYLACPHPKEQPSHQLLCTCLASEVSLHSLYYNLSPHMDCGTNVLAMTM